MLKNVKVCLITIAFMLVSMLGLSSVSADTILYKECSEITLTQEFLNIAMVSNPTVSSNKTEAIYLENGNEVLYCLQKGAALSWNGEHVTASFIEQATNSGTAKWIARAIAYGYPSYESGHYKGNCYDRRMSTQLLVQIIAKQGENGAWRTYTRADFAKFVDGTRASEVINGMVDIRDKALAVDVKPSFAGQTIPLKYNPSTYNWIGTATDTNNSIGGWTTTNKDVTLSVSGNVLTITKTSDNPVTGTINYTRNIPKGLLYYSNYDAKWQKTAYYVSGGNEPVNFNIKYNVEDINKGIVEIIKTDKYTKNKMENVSFGIYSDEKCTVKAKDYLGKEQVDKKTDKNGKITWTDLYMPLENGKYKTYYVKEAIPEGYVQDSKELQKQGAKDGCIPVQAEATVPNKEKNQETDTNKKTTASLKVNNIPYGNITIQKTDSVTRKVIEGVEFKLSVKNGNKTEVAKDINGKEVKNAVTDKRGIAEFKDIPYGDYIIEEIKADDWYKILEKPLEFTLNKDSDALKYKAQGTEAIPSKGDVLIPSEKYLLGDPSDDGKIDNDDIKIIDSIIAMQIEETEKQFYAADVNKDNVVDSKDKELLQKYINGDTTAIPDALKEFEVSNYQKRVSLSVTNVPLDMKISKVSITNEKELPGAKIVIKNSKGEVFIEYTSTKKQKEFYIPIGDYTLIETIAPKGYQKLKTEVKFRVLANGNIKMISATSSTHKLVKSQDGDLDHLKIFNSPEKISVPNTGSVIAISTLVVGIGLIGGGAYALYRKYKMN